MDHFWYFQLTFVHSKCKRSSLRSQCMLNETFSVIFKHREKAHCESYTLLQSSRDQECVCNSIHFGKTHEKGLVFGLTFVTWP